MGGAEGLGWRSGAMTELPLLTGEKVVKVGKVFPTFILKAPRLHITLRNRALISYLHSDN